MHAIPTTYFSSLGLLSCRQCNLPKALYSSPHHHTRHCSQSCLNRPAQPQTNPTNQSHTNQTTTRAFSTSLAIIIKSYRASQPTQWEASLKFLYSLDPQPVQYRSNLYRHLNKQTKQILFSTLNHVQHWLLQLHTHTQDPNAFPTATAASQPHLFSTKPLWILLLAFDALLLHPNKEHKGSPNHLVRTRLKAFKAGNIQALWTASQAKPKQTSPSKEDHNHQAQLAADEDNYRTAFARLTKAMPVAQMTPENQEQCSKLYVEQKSYQSTRRSTRTNPSTFSLVNTEVLLRALQKVNSGTAAGPNGDFPAVLKDYALFQPNKDSPDYRPNLSIFADVTQLIVNNQLHPSLQTYFSSNWFMALHKDTEDKSKLRPIGMGTAYRRITGKYLMMLLDEEIAKALTPFGQWGIAVRGGIDFMIHTTRVLVERHLKPNDETRTAIALDLVNCWNNTSRKAAQDELADDPSLQQLLPFVELLYDHAVPCYYTDDQGVIQNFLQEEGHCQGCPLAPTLSCLTLLKLLRKLQAFLATRARA